MAHGLSDAAAERQLAQMIDFIKLEAREKAEELRTQANQDYEMEKLLREQHAKTKLAAQFEQLEQERITQRRVAMSKELSRFRTERLDEQATMLRELVDEAGSQLSRFAAQSPAAYEALLTRLMAQGALTVIGAGNGGTHAVRVRCRAVDVTAVQGCCAAAAVAAGEQFAAAAAADAAARAATKAAVLGARLPPAPAGGVQPPALPTVTVTLSVDAARPLSPNCSGGVVVTSADGLVVADNTLEARLAIAAAGLQPVVKAVVFPPPPQAPAAAGGEADLLSLA